MIRQLIIAFLFIPNLVNAQKKVISDEQIQQFVNFRPPYTKNNGEYYGAGFKVDANNMVIVFREVWFDTGTKELSVKGTTFHTVAAEDARLDGVEIFLARPKNNKLKSIRVLGHSKTNQGTIADYGDFEFTFKLIDKDRLYFMAGDSFYLVEYNISKAIRIR